MKKREGIETCCEMDQLRILHQSSPSSECSDKSNSRIHEFDDVDISMAMTSIYIMMLILIIAIVLRQGDVEVLTLPVDN